MTGLCFWLCTKCKSFVGINLRTCRKCGRRRSKKFDDELAKKLLRLQARARRIRQASTGEDDV